MVKAKIKVVYKKKGKKKESTIGSFQLFKQQRELQKEMKHPYYQDIKDAPIKERAKVYAQIKARIAQEKQVKQLEKTPTRVYVEARKKLLIKRAKARVEHVLSKEYLKKRSIRARKFKKTKWDRRRLAPMTYHPPHDLIQYSSEKPRGILNQKQIF